MPFMNSSRASFGAQGRKNSPWRAYSFTSHTFTTAGVTGSSGPSLAQCRSAYSATTWANTYLNMTTNGIQLWTVPQTGFYRIQAAGAGGVTTNGSSVVSSGANIAGTFYLSGGSILKILVGQLGIGGGQGGAGGGGTFVTKNDNTPLIIAGGGGGAGLSGATSAEYHLNAITATSDSGTGSAGNGGNYSSSSGGCGAAGGGGGGLAGDGGWNGNSSYPGAKSFINGGVGGTTQPSTDGNPCVGISYGGFGGGCGGGNTGGGGGGYSGGHGDSYPGGGYQAGNGGGSYNSGSSQTSAVNNSAAGYVIITKL